VNAKRLLPAIVWAAFIFVLCSIPGKDIPAAGWMDIISLDKWVHFGVFAVLMWLTLRAVRAHYRQEHFALDGRWIWLLLVVLYGGLTEGYQHWMLEDRYADLYDFVANTAGAIAAWWIYERYFSRRQRSETYQKTF